ncbi:DUF2474 family protein [Sulfitobacter sp.]|jgi:hypothetical protein|tara:strand:- start:871 stop:981 length:111 start_codon:yes stop_codon:yes gene_type:complete
MAQGSLRRIGWFIAIWLASVLALGVVAYAIRLAIYA